MPHDQDGNISKIPPIRVSSIDLGRRGGEEESHGLAGFLHIPLLGVRGSDRTQTFGEERVDVGTHVPGQCLYGNCQETKMGVGRRPQRQEWGSELSCISVTARSDTDCSTRPLP